MDTCEYQVGFEQFEGRMVSKTCSKPGRRFEYWFMCANHSRAVLKRLGLMKREKLTNFEMRINSK